MPSARQVVFSLRGSPVFRRNPRVFPPAKSKLLREKTVHVPDPTEKKFLDAWWFDYKREVAAIVDALRYSFEVKDSSNDKSGRVIERAFDTDLIVINNQWNKQTELKRERFYAHHFNEKISENIVKCEEYDKIEAGRIEQLKTKLLTVKDYDHTIVTKENIDKRLDEIMSSPPVEYNFAVSERGKRLDSTKPIVPSNECK